VFTARWLPTVDTLVGYFDRHGSANDRMMAHYLKGRVHHDMGESPQALECYQRAAEQADTTRSDCDLYTLYAVYGQMANLFHAQYLPED
jgi:tetratricopeptide (TPR) repeat protein